MTLENQILQVQPLLDNFISSIHNLLSFKYVIAYAPFTVVVTEATATMNMNTGHSRSLVYDIDIKSNTVNIKYK